MLRDQGFAAALHALADQVGAANRLRIDLNVAESDRLGETAQVALYTIIRELLDQAIRRGPPTRVSVTMTANVDGGIETRVSDDAEPERRRRTFEAIEERVHQLHGTIDMSVEQGRTTVAVMLPAYATRR